MSRSEVPQCQQDGVKVNGTTVPTSRCQGLWYHGANQTVSRSVVAQCQPDGVKVCDTTVPTRGSQGQWYQDANQNITAPQGQIQRPKSKAMPIFCSAVWNGSRGLASLQYRSLCSFTETTQNEHHLTSQITINIELFVHPLTERISGKAAGWRFSQKLKFVGTVK